MFGAATTIKVPRVGKRGQLALTDTMAEIMYRTALQGVSEYLDTLYRLVPIWTGRLQRSFKPLADELKDLGARRSAGTGGGRIQPTQNARNWFNKIGQDDLGPIDADLSSKTSYRLPRAGSKTQFSFSFKSGVYYYPLNDVNTYNSPASPWNSQEEALKALNAYVADILPKRVQYALPRLVRALLTTNLGGGTQETNLRTGQTREVYSEAQIKTLALKGTKINRNTVKVVK